MGKNKEKNANRTSTGFLDVFCVHESPQKLAISTDTDSSVVGSPRRLKTCSSEKAKKKHKKRHLLTQECERERSESCSPQAESKLDFADKKKKKRSRDEEDEMSVTLMSDESEMMTDEITGNAGKKKKKKKDKEKKSYMEILESSALSEQSVHENGSGNLHEIGVANGECNVLTEPEENQADNIQVKRKKDKKKKKDKEKKNEIKILGSEESVQENESTGPCVMEDVNVSAEDVQVKEKKKKKKKDKEKQNQIEILESENVVEEKRLTDSDEIDSVNVATEPGENQTENIPTKKRKEKESKHKEKQNQTQVLGSATTPAAAVYTVKQKGSTHPHKTKDLEVEPEESPSKKRRKKNGDTPVKGDLKTRETQTVPRRISAKMERETDEDSEDDRLQIGTGFGNNESKKRGPKKVDQRLLEELKHFVPNIESREPDYINRMINFDLPRYKQFKKKGIPLNRGRFTAKENETLKKNVEDFLALTGIDSGTKLFYTDRFDEEIITLRNLKRNHRFFAAIAKGIPRSCHDVYARGRRIFDSNVHKGKFSESELHQLCKLQTLHGNNWKKISELTGRSALSLENRYSQLTKRTGMWSKKEVQRLLRAVRDHLVSEVQPRATDIGSIRVSREMLYKGLPWRTISEKVKTRSWIKCREKWLSVLPSKMSCGAVQTGGTTETKIKLIKAMYQMQVDDIANVDWDELTALFGDVPPSYVQRKWNTLKIKHVPNWQSKCFGDTVDFLYENVLPFLEMNTAYQSDDDFTQLERSQVKSFLLSDIFEDVRDQDSGEEEEEDDNKEKSEEEEQEKEDGDREESNMD